MKRRIALLVASTALAASGVAVPTGTAFADAPPCEAGDPGCKTVDDPTKSNPKFTESQRGNLDAPGTENTCTGANNGQTKQVCG
jgi:hypothetical protein